MFLLKVLQARQQPARGKSGHHGEFKVHRTLLTHDRQGIALYSIELGCDPAAVGQSGLGEHHAAARTPKQIQAEEGF